MTFKNPRLEISARFTHYIAAVCLPLRKTFSYLILTLHIKITWRKYKKTFYFNMKISQKLVSLRCRVLVKNKRLVVFWLLIKMHVLSWVKAEECTYFFRMSVSSDTVSHMQPFSPCPGEAGSLLLVPAEVDLPGPVSTFLDQWLVELTSCTRVDIRPTELTVILQASDIGTEKGSKFPTTACALAFVTHLVIQHIWLHLHLENERRMS